VITLPTNACPRIHAAKKRVVQTDRMFEHQQ
jgi:hypothetical protein